MKRYSLLNPPLPAADSGAVRWQGLPPTAAGLAIARAAEAHPGPVLVLCADSQSAHALEAAIGVFAGDLPVDPFPDWETLPYDLFSPHPDIVSARLSLLAGLAGSGRRIIVSPAVPVTQRLAPRQYVNGFGLKVGIGQRLAVGDERRRLEEAGYRCVPQVTEHGEFAVRGALLDLFPMGADVPYRIELFDDEVESIRSFDPETQLSIEKVEGVELLPAREYPFDDEAVERFRAAFRMRFDADLRRCTLYQDARNGIAGAGIEYYLPLFFEHTETLFDYLPSRTLLVVDERVESAITVFQAALSERYESRRHDVERPILRPDELYIDGQAMTAAMSRFAQIRWQTSADEGSNFDWQPPPEIRLDRPEEAGSALSELRGAGGRLVVAVESAGRREVVADRLAKLGARPVAVDHWQRALEGSDPVVSLIAGLEDGFVLADRDLTLVTERQLFGSRHHARRGEVRAGRDPETIIRDLTDLHVGAPVVHEDYGVGRYLGLQRIDSGGVAAEFLTLEYAGGDKLYVPVSALDIISRYTGTAPEHAPLHRLGSNQWTRARRKAAEKARDVAAELLDIYARREARGGHAIVPEAADLSAFEDGFPFEATPDQASAIEAVLSDIASPRPMDRVVCGDVGFGKTEVALRAAFAVASTGRQVALLVPTTLLAQQHLKNFQDRFANWPIRIEALSRFRSRQEADAVIRDLTSGAIDIVIGTHRLLQRDVRFKSLGLLIIDEEQRFGVRQKEQIKQLRAEVDVLTLTATPIPRTLNMALAGLRDLSIIATPPAHRMAVKTYVNQWDASILRDTIQRELQRGGQIFFLHNEVQSIERMARELTELFPEARLNVAHGQMPERELEQVMLDFYHQRFNLLICTTIIESGIDIPTANTIVINRADRFGLAQLHQLRGRVGRSHHRAYAYLIVPHPKAMTGDAIKRLEALESLDELGAGFTLATHDLEIRGAGELLGDEQSGQIQEVGFSLYTDLLERAVRALREGREPELEAPLEHGSKVDLGIQALIPDDYLPDVHARLVLYKRIASAEDPDALERLQVEMIDRFGLLPQAVKNLFEVARLKLLAAPIGVRELTVDGDGGRLVFVDQPSIDPMTLIRLVQSQPEAYRFDGQDKLRFQMPLPEPGDRIGAAEDLLLRLREKHAA